MLEYSSRSNMKRVTLELGGKSTLIIMEDADIEQALNAAHVGLFLNHGQCCCASSRIYIHEDVHDAFVAKVMEKAKSISSTYNKTDTSECFLGPQVDKIQ